MNSTCLAVWLHLVVLIGIPQLCNTRPPFKLPLSSTLKYNTASVSACCCRLYRLPLPPTFTADEELDQNLALIKDASLRDTLQFGIGLHHAGLAESDREVVEALYVGGKIQVCGGALGLLSRWRIHPQQCSLPEPGFAQLACSPMHITRPAALP